MGPFKKLTIMGPFKKFSLLPKLKFSPPYSVQPECVNHRHFKLRLFDLEQNSKFEISKIYDIRLQRYKDLKILRLCQKTQSLNTADNYCKKTL